MEEPLILVGIVFACALIIYSEHLLLRVIGRKLTSVIMAGSIVVLLNAFTALFVLAI
jgi:hypothetical protein